MNKLEIQPVRTINSEVYMPGSKSITNRALIIGALSDGETCFKNALFSDDTKYMQKALKDVGIHVHSNELTNEIRITGTNGQFNTPSNEIFVGNAGTAMRFLTTFFTLGNGKFILTGDDRMQERPIRDLVDGLKNLSVKINYLKNEGCPPLEIHANGLKGGKTTMKGEVSSQYFSSLLLSGCYAENDIEIKVDGDLVSKPYIDITSKLMSDFGVGFVNMDYQQFKIPAKQIYRHQKTYFIEGDASNASYFFGAAAVTGGKIRVYNVSKDTIQGDIQFVELLKQMGCQVEYGINYIEVIGNKKLKGIDVDMRHISDVVQTLSVVALFAEGKTVIRNVANMRVKETDRIHALYNELTKIGAEVEEKEDGLVITPKDKYNACEIETYNDHRMAMSFSLAGLRIKGINLLDPNCVSKTFPNYFKLFEKICL